MLIDSDIIQLRSDSGLTVSLLQVRTTSFITRHRSMLLAPCDRKGTFSENYFDVQSFFGSRPTEPVIEIRTNVIHEFVVAQML